MRTCEAPDCEKPHHSNGYCSTHAARLRRTGALETPHRKRNSTLQTYTLEERLWARTKVEDRGHETECWVYYGNKSTLKADGSYYAKIRVGSTMVGVHLAAFRELVRPTESNEHVHHLCDTKPCWRPDHLEAMTVRDHAQEHRGHSANGVCLAPSCNRTDLEGWGFCRLHYQRLWKAGAFR